MWPDALWRTFRTATRYTDARETYMTRDDIRKMRDQRDASAMRQIRDAFAAIRTARPPRLTQGDSDLIQQPEPPEPVAREDIELVTEDLTGWRVYYLDYDLPDGACLYGSRGTPWRTPELVAACTPTQWKGSLIGAIDGQQEQQEQAVRHLSVGGCHCGIYSYKSPQQITNHSIRNVIARCSNFGIVVEHEKGYRAERVRIDSLYLMRPSKASESLLWWLYAMRDYLARRYDVHAGILTETEWKSLCEMHDKEWTES